jgi:hypothetical protein
MLECGLTRAALIPQLKAVAGALNATRPADMKFQVSCCEKCSGVASVPSAAGALQ